MAISLNITKQDKKTDTLTAAIPSRLYERFKKRCTELESDMDYVLIQILSQAFPDELEPRKYGRKANADKPASGNGRGRKAAGAGA